jgi:uncharacterized protein YbbK (DUF523 family)
MRAVAPLHLPTEVDIAGWPTATVDHPIPVLVSACLLGLECGVDGSSYGAPYPSTQQLIELPNVEVHWFCPEDYAFGTPRQTPDIHGGSGPDVLDGRAVVLSESGQDWTRPMCRAAEAMLHQATQHRVRFALLMDISAACGSQVVYSGARSEGVHQPGQGVAAALLIRHGFKVVSHRDDKTLGHIIRSLNPVFVPPPDLKDHHESEWYRQHFGDLAAPPSSGVLEKDPD